MQNEEAQDLINKLGKAKEKGKKMVEEEWSQLIFSRHYPLVIRVEYYVEYLINIREYIHSIFYGIY